MSSTAEDRFACDRVDQIARRFGYTQTQLCKRERLIAFTRASSCADGKRELVRVWYSTGTVNTCLKHPRQGKTQLFRRGIESYEELAAIFENPRTHTGKGYQRVPKTDEKKDVPCVGCGKKFKAISGSVQHFETGRCPSCPGEANAREQVYNYANQSNANFMIKRIANGDDEVNTSYREDGANFRCPAPGCSKEFEKLASLMQHMENKLSCREFKGCAGNLQIGYN